MIHWTQEVSKRTLRAMVQQELAKQLATPSRSPPQSDISQQLKELKETINQWGSRLENVETAIRTRPSSYISAHAEPVDPPAYDVVGDRICRKGSNYTVVGNSAVAEGDIIVGTTKPSGQFAPGITPHS